LQWPVLIYPHLLGAWPAVPRYGSSLANGLDEHLGVHVAFAFVNFDCSGERFDERFNIHPSFFGQMDIYTRPALPVFSILFAST
jgi:hypothetical protein